MSYTRFGYHNLGKIIRLLIDQPLTSRQLSELTNLGVDPARHVCKHLHKAKLVYIADWEFVPPCSYAPCFRFGEGVDAPAMTRFAKNQTRILQKLAEQPNNPKPAAVLAEELNLTENCTKKHLNILVKRHLIAALPTRKRCPKYLYKLITLPSTAKNKPHKPRPTAISKSRQNTRTPQSWFSMLAN